MQLNLQKAFLSEYNRQERFYSKHNHYATNQSTSHSLQDTVPKSVSDQSSKKGPAMFGQS